MVMNRSVGARCRGVEQEHAVVEGHQLSLLRDLSHLLLGAVVSAVYAQGSVANVDVESAEKQR